MTLGTVARLLQMSSVSRRGCPTLGEGGRLSERLRDSRRGFITPGKVLWLQERLRDSRDTAFFENLGDLKKSYMISGEVARVYCAFGNVFHGQLVWVDLGLGGAGTHFHPDWGEP